MTMKRKEEPLHKNPGIYKRFTFDEKSQKWIDTGKYRAIRNIMENGEPKKRAAVFDNVQDAKAYRMGLLEKNTGGTNTHHVSLDDPNQRYTFGALVDDWKSLHYLEIELTSQQMYETRLPHLQFLKNCNVDDITTAVVTGLVKHWASHEYPKPKGRQTFEKELDVLKVVLNFYKRHRNNAYFIPILSDHYRAADFAKKAESPVRGLKQLDLGKFLNRLHVRYPQHYALALIQLGLGLRIGETLALYWDDLDLDNGTATIQRNVAWDKKQQMLFLKLRKNKKALRVALPALLVQELLALKKTRDRSTPLVFHREGQLLKRQQISKAYNRVLESLGISYVKGTHMLRKTSGTLARKITGDVYAASKLLDHSSVNITEKYYQEELDEDKVMVAAALNGVLAGFVGESGGNFPENSRGENDPIPQHPLLSTHSKLTLVKSNT
jgi:integrase